MTIAEAFVYWAEQRELHHLKQMAGISSYRMILAGNYGPMPVRLWVK